MAFPLKKCEWALRDVCGQQNGSAKKICGASKALSKFNPPLLLPQPQGETKHHYFINESKSPFLYQTDPLKQQTRLHIRETSRQCTSLY